VAPDINAAERSLRPLVTQCKISGGTRSPEGSETLMLKQHPLRVAGAKLTDVGCYRDVLAMRDVGADFVLDFVDVGLASTLVPPDQFAAYGVAWHACCSLTGSVIVGPLGIPSAVGAPPRDLLPQLLREETTASAGARQERRGQDQAGTRRR
jgi:hypothetical protein